MKNLKKHLTIYLYVFIIFTSMIPSKENITKISELKTIIPGIENLYKNNNNNKDEEKEYSFKLLEFIQNII